jgi:hypothetical protein
LKNNIDLLDLFGTEGCEDLNDVTDEQIGELFSSIIFFYKCMLRTVNDIIEWGSNNLVTYYYAQLYNENNNSFFSV